MNQQPKAIILPYGEAGWMEKIRFLEKIISDRQAPPFIYNDVLIIVTSSRLKRTYNRLFLDLAERGGASALVQPDIQTLHQFMEKLSSRFKGPRLIDENSRLVLLEGLVKERLTGDSLFGQSPDLLAPSLSAALAKMIEQLSAAGVSSADLSGKIRDADFFDKPQVRLLTDVYDRYTAVLEKRELVDPAGMRRDLLDRFDPEWLSSYRALVIDNIQDAGRLEAGLLRKVAACKNCVHLLEAPSTELLERADEFHPLRITRDFLSELGTLPEQQETSLDNDNLFLAESLFSDRPFGDTARNAPAAFTKNIRLLSAVNTREEVSLLAREVKLSLQRATPAESILVAFPSLDEYGPLVEEIFIDCGIPYNRALGRQLSSSPVVTAVISLLRACQEDFSGPALLRVFSAPFLRFAETPAVAPALDRLMRDRRITGGKEKLLAALRQQVPSEDGGDILSGPLTELFAALEPFRTKDPAPLVVWMERLRKLISQAGLPARVNLIHGPLNINLQAYKMLDSTLGSLSLAGQLFPEYTYTFNEWLFLLKKTFMHARFQVPPEDEGGVQILGLEESVGHPWKEIYLGGLVDNSFPQRLPQNIFLPEKTLELMGVRTLEKARRNASYHFYRLLLGAPKITLTHPENEGDRPAVASPFLEELTPLKIAGLLNRGVGKTSGLQSSLKLEESYSIPELAKALSQFKNSPDLPDLLNAPIPGMTGIRSALAQAPARPSQSIAIPGKRTFRVTELDAYLSCPFDYYVTKVLGLGPLEEVTEDMAPGDRGVKVHAILRNFYLSWTGAITKVNKAEARALLKKLADSAFANEADTFRNRRDRELFMNRMAERFLDAEEEFWKQGFRPAILEKQLDRYPLALSNGTEVELSARIDRIDVDAEGNFLIVDYKTGRYPTPKMTIEQDIFQLPVYALMAQAVLKVDTPALRKPTGLVYYDLAGTTGAGARDVVLFNKEALNDQPSSKPKASPKTAEEFEAILKLSMDKARKTIEAILSGDFPALPREESKCRYCPNDMMCEDELS